MSLSKLSVLDQRGTRYVPQPRTFVGCGLLSHDQVIAISKRVPGWYLCLFGCVLNHIYLARCHNLERIWVMLPLIEYLLRSLDNALADHLQLVKRGLFVECRTGTACFVQQPQFSLLKQHLRRRKKRKRKNNSCWAACVACVFYHSAKQTRTDSSMHHAESI